MQRGAVRNFDPGHFANFELKHGTAVARIYDKLQSTSLAMNFTLKLLWQKIEEVQASSEGTYLLLSFLRIATKNLA